MSESLWLADENATEALGACLASVFGSGGLLFLEGDLGTGKTTLTRGMLRSLGHEGAVKSPTYTLVEPYEMLEPAVYHFDLYRLGEPEELEMMGIRDYMDREALVIVEWPRRGEGLLPEPDCHIELEHAGEGRRARLTAWSVPGETLVARAVNAFESREM